jgi:hypothetical protein
MDDSRDARFDPTHALQTIRDLFFTDTPAKLAQHAVYSHGAGVLLGRATPTIALFLDPTTPPEARDLILTRVRANVQPAVEPLSMSRPAALTTRVQPSLSGDTKIAPYDRRQYNFGYGFGSLGCLATDGKTHFILSANHVLAHNGRVGKGTSIYSPGHMLKVSNGAKIAKLHDWIEMGAGPDNVDAALAKCSSVPAVAQRAAINPIVVSHTGPSLSVQKTGAVSRTTTSTLDMTNVRLWRMTFPFGSYEFKNLVGTVVDTAPANSVAGTLGADVLAWPGDSGALVVPVNSPGDGIGLVMARSYEFNQTTGDFQGYRTWISQLVDIADRFQRKGLTLQFYHPV